MNKSQTPTIKLQNRPVIIIGAPRSGTNMIRNCLVKLPGFSTWPCDEIPFIWRHKNRAHPDDEFFADMANPAVKFFIRNEFNKVSSGCQQITVEKTCANSLRPNFVAEILPEAVFLYIVRNGVDATASAIKRWKAPLDLKYSLAKAKFIPTSDIFFYGHRVFRNRLRRLFSKEKRLSVWGPVYKGMMSDAGNLDLHSLAARQWLRCVSTSDEQLGLIQSEKVLTIRYEDFVRNPVEKLTGIIQSLEVNVPKNALLSAVEGVSDKSVGKGTSQLSNIEIEKIGKIFGSKLLEHGYSLD